MTSIRQKQSYEPICNMIAPLLRLVNAMASLSSTIGSATNVRWMTSILVLTKCLHLKSSHSSLHSNYLAYSWHWICLNMNMPWNRFIGTPTMKSSSLRNTSIHLWCSKKYYCQVRCYQWSRRSYSLYHECSKSVVKSKDYLRYSSNPSQSSWTTRKTLLNVSSMLISMTIKGNTINKM